MINLKLTKSEKESECDIGMDDNPYPYGTRINIDDEHLAALNLNAKIGDTVEIRAKAEVVSMSAHEDADADKPHKSMSFQLTDIEVKKPGKSPMAVLYGDDSE